MVIFHSSVSFSPFLQCSRLISWLVPETHPGQWLAFLSHGNLNPTKMDDDWGILWGQLHIFWEELMNSSPHVPWREIPHIIHVTKKVPHMLKNIILAVAVPVSCQKPWWRSAANGPRFLESILLEKVSCWLHLMSLVSGPQNMYVFVVYSWYFRAHWIVYDPKNENLRGSSG